MVINAKLIVITPVDGGVYGKSITDPCLGWEKTEKMILDIADRL